MQNEWGVAVSATGEDSMKTKHLVADEPVYRILRPNPLQRGVRIGSRTGGLFSAFDLLF